MGTNNEVESNEELKITLTFDNDQTVECVCIAVFPVDGKEYMALLPLEEVGDITTEEILLYRYTPSDNEEDLLLDDLSDEEYEKVSDAFDALLDEEEFAEVLDDIEE